MLWAVNLPRRPRPLRSSGPVLRVLSRKAATYLRYGVGFFGGLEAFSFRCPGPCASLHQIRPWHDSGGFNRRTQRFRCPVCGIELQLSIVADVLPPRRITKRVFHDIVLRTVDTVPTIEQAAQLRTYQVPMESEDL